ncbi:efflux RND transporter periplasmic adaptor subunit [Catenovulum sp. 2E275]|uniref:efflux RND transporter periplasmic adaptor subunit n=1 Tax=Catenovulum sp. 2E275 TaxID=2980497 RepID=UPI0021CE71D7|nr:efflux RND transporter periplasmic adaptor subunit [Catenovulum sp. 2E275]MCU4677520.1 efflux RND transporter periplasmic adaptor subunit [Catenovulum sp. 2E275]
MPQLLKSIYLISGLLLITACTEEKQPTASVSKIKEEPVLTQAVSMHHKAVNIQAVGTSRALKSVVLYPRISGIIESMNVQAGEMVKAGKNLIELDANEQTLLVKQAEISLADAQRTYKRYQAAVTSGGVTQSMLDEANTNLASTQVAFNRAKVLLDYHFIKAPFSGHLGLTQLDPGAYIDTQTPLVSLDDRSSLLIMFEVAEAFYGQLKIGQQVEVAPWQNAAQIAQAEVVDIDSRVDPQSRTFTVQAKLNNQADLYRPGMSFKVMLNLVSGQYPLVPETALQWGGDGAYIWKIDNGQAKRMPVVVVQRLKGEILVEADLPVGTLVVKEGIQRMREGMKVTDVSTQVQQRLLGNE